MSAVSTKLQKIFGVNCSSKRGFPGSQTPYSVLGYPTGVYDTPARAQTLIGQMYVVENIELISLLFSTT